MSPTVRFVRPATTLTPETVALAPSDQFIIRNFVSTILCFKLDINASIEGVITNLHQGLANTLVELPFLAGTLVPESEERCTKQVNIPEDAGVEFKVKDLRHKSGSAMYDFDELIKCGFPPSVLDFDTLVHGTLIPGLEPACLTMQANFIQGGLLLVFHMHHAVMDGSGLFSLFECLAKHTAAISRAQIISSCDLIQDECLDRTVLFSGPALRQMIEYPGFRPAQEHSWAAKADASKLMARLIIQSEDLTAKRVNKSWWIIRPNQLRKLQEEVMSTDRNSIKMTLSSTLSALFWRHISLARKMHESKVEYSGLTTVCDFRSRLDPPLPPGYVGNALVFARARLLVTELCSDEPNTLYKIASSISESVNWWDSERIQGLLGAAEGTDMRSVEWDSDTHFGPDVQVTSTMSASSPYSIDWGQQLGNMQALRFPTGAFYDGFVTVLPRLPDGSIEFVLNCGSEVFTELKADKEFTRYASFLCS
ncbi:hypothetical protein BP5796_02074 [Coleophoma crateriformis]|uniref:Trichothecene 3-O-acetyltransferase n=1 Tax=Coleophoma crateriformis TaxID=565419 RepID=A0A3D8SXB8_9HELO|nr:hypothetical protein BP5796_02074 [Coleophoma crateriformis]